MFALFVMIKNIIYCVNYTKLEVALYRIKRGQSSTIYFGMKKYLCL